MFNQKRILSGVLKAKIYILYNDVCNRDICFLYKYLFSFANYQKIKFIKLSTLIKRIKSDNNIVIFDRDNYTLLKDNVKRRNIDDIDYIPILINADDKGKLNFADKNIIWKSLKSHFTNL